MHTKRLFKFTGAAAYLAMMTAALVLCGCTARFVDYTLLSTKDIDLSKAGTFKRSPNRVTGVDNRYWIIIIPTGAKPNLKTAVDRAIESVPGAVGLVDGVVSARRWWFLFGEGAVIVEGTPLIDPSLPGAQASLDAERFVSFYNPASGKQESRAVSKTAYQEIKCLAENHDNAGLSKALLALR